MSLQFWLHKTSSLLRGQGISYGKPWRRHLRDSSHIPAGDAPLNAVFYLCTFTVLYFKFTLLLSINPASDPLSITSQQDQKLNTKLSRSSSSHETSIFLVGTKYSTLTRMRNGSSYTPQRGHYTEITQRICHSSFGSKSHPQPAIAGSPHSKCWLSIAPKP